jgi:transcription-repair coupling factor (superfamily II helicase)
VKFLAAHGQMPAGQLEKAMWDFLHRKYDVMVASTIIESGLDIPTVNTLIVEDAHEFGLAQLYQIRGRVGRERVKAYCHLFYPAAFGDFEALSEDAKRRLSALREFSSLGSGFRLALRDLEIRGAGDLLGPKQHGFLNSVGLEYYCNLLNAEIERLKGGAAAAEEPVTLDLLAPAGIPGDYLPSELDRIEFYKRMLAAKKDADLDAIVAELEDLSGPMPRPARTLLRMLKLKLRAARAGVRSVAERAGGVMEVAFQPKTALDPERFQAISREYQGRIRFFSSQEGDGFRVTLGRVDALEWLDGFLSSLVVK